MSAVGKLKDGGRFSEFAPPRLPRLFRLRHDDTTETLTCTRRPRYAGRHLLEIESDAPGGQPKVRYDREEGQPELRHIAVRNLYRALLRVNLKHVARPLRSSWPYPCQSKAGPILARDLTQKPLVRAGAWPVRFIFHRRGQTHDITAGRSRCRHHDGCVVCQYAKGAADRTTARLLLAAPQARAQATYPLSHNAPLRIS